MSRPKAKRCPRCGQVKPADRFYRRRRGRAVVARLPALHPGRLA
jgi:hypothetical protein